MNGIYSTNNIHPMMISGNQQANATFGLFQKASSNGWLFRLKAFFLRRPKELLDLNAVKKEIPLGNSHTVGRRDVSIDRIVGTEGRVQDFDRGFHPLCERMRDRWMRVAGAILANEPMPPIELIQVGDSYFVRDGHHRISVSRALGREVIEADVIAWDVADPYKQYGAFKNVCC